MKELLLSAIECTTLC